MRGQGRAGHREGGSGIIRLIPTLLLLAVLAGCAAPPPVAPPPATPAPYRCLLPAEHRMLVAEFFFGRTGVGAAAWAAFAARVLTPNFPDGFTVFDGTGQWRNPHTGIVVREPSKIVLVAARRQPDLARRVAAVIDAYKAEFHQQSVGLVTRDSCAAF